MRLCICAQVKVGLFIEKDQVIVIQGGAARGQCRKGVFPRGEEVRQRKRGWRRLHRKQGIHPCSREKSVREAFISLM